MSIDNSEQVQATARKRCRQGFVDVFDDERVALRGHMATQKPSQGEDLKHSYWEGWIDYKGKLTQKTGDVIVWENQDWQKLFKPGIDSKGR